jgi:hypothetical protein
MNFISNNKGGSIMEIKDKNEVSFKKTEDLRKILEKLLATTELDCSNKLNERGGATFDYLLQEYVNRDRKDLYEYIISKSISKPTVIFKDLSIKNFSSITFDKDVVYYRETKYYEPISPYNEHILYTVIQHCYGEKIGLTKISFNSAKDELSSFENVVDIQSNCMPPAIDISEYYSKYLYNPSVTRIYSMDDLLYFTIESIKKYLENHPNDYYVV